MPIDRKALVSRSSPEFHELSTEPLLQVGNGEFAFSFDATGFQTFAGNTMSQWSWHSFPLPPWLSVESFKMKSYAGANGKAVGYPTSSEGQEELYKWLRENPHRFNLGRLRLMAGGREIKPDSIACVSQRLCLWTGVASSRFKLAGGAVCVETCCHPGRNLLAFRVESSSAETLDLVLDFPYGDLGVSGGRWDKPGAHFSELSKTGIGFAEIKRRLDADCYSVALSWHGAELVQPSGPHSFSLKLKGGAAELLCEFSKDSPFAAPLSFREVRDASAAKWEKFWSSGGSVDLSESEDSRWPELERRIVLSQYLLAVNESGSLPPQESGLYNNSGWYGKFHLEMHWWHGAHWALWGRWELFEKSLRWYHEALPQAIACAKAQGSKGARWPKMVGPEGRESPSAIGPLLIWQQPHPIFYAELDRRLHPGIETLSRWREIVFESADFMASFATWSPSRGQFILDAPLKTVPENTDEMKTCNPTYELGCWRFGLRVALEWQRLLGLPENSVWADVERNLAPLPSADGRYLLQEGMDDTYGKWSYEHPSMLGVSGMLPGDGTDSETMKRTIESAAASWQWDRCWGWDFPLAAMAAARNGMPGLAIEMLLHPSSRNFFDRAGLSHGGPYPYFPSNGGLLYAVAMMAAGWDGALANDAPGFPSGWKVNSEGLSKAL